MSLCSLCVLCVSVVNIGSLLTTTETQRAQRLHREDEKNMSRVETGLERLNQLPASEAESELRKCCGSEEWAQLVTAARPFASIDELFSEGDRAWWSLGEGHWLEAFHSHPKIGERKAANAVAVEAQRWSEAEQSGVRNSAPETMQALAELNREYERKFGYIFIVCASGKSSEEMLALLRSRLDNPASQELQIAAGEQAKITRLRLEKLVGEQQHSLPGP